MTAHNHKQSAINAVKCLHGLKTNLMYRKIYKRLPRETVHGDLGGFQKKGLEDELLLTVMLVT